jgi:transposase
MTPIEIQAEVLTRYFTEKQSVRRIAKDLDLHRRSVVRIIKRRTIHESRQIGPKKSILDPFKEEIKTILDKNPKCSGVAILNKLRRLGYLGGKTTLNCYLYDIRLKNKRPREAFLRLEFAPGQTAQVDWGEFGDVFRDGAKIHCFAMVLCYSRYFYLEFTRSEKFEDFIRCHENAFRFFGGVPRECWYDNLTSAVTDRLGSLIRFNARFMAYMGHHGIRPHACNVARGNEKGRVEDLIKYVRMNFWPGRTFLDFDDLNKQAIDWRTQVANQREHRTTRRIVRLFFEAEEQKFLLARNPNVYDTDELLSRVVPPDFHILYETNRYSVPWTLVGSTVTLRVNHLQIKIFYSERIVTAHPRSYRRGQVFTHEPHRQGLLEIKPGVQKDGWQIAAVKNIGPTMEKYIDIVRSGHRSLRYELGRILALSTVYGDDAVNRACSDLLERGIIGVDSLELTLKRLHHPAQSDLKPEPLNFNDQKLNRVVPVVDLRRYDALLFENHNKCASETNEEDNGTKSE